MLESLDFGHNPVLQGGLALMVVGGLLYQLQALPRTLYNYFERFFILKMEILDDDEAFQWMRVWLADRLKNNLSVSVVTKRTNSHGEDGTYSLTPIKPKVYFVPAVGVYFFWYRGRLVSLSRDRYERTTTTLAHGAAGEPTSAMHDKESFTLRIFSRNRDLARSLVEECRDRALPDDGRINIFVARHNYWYIGSRVTPRPLNSVILDGTAAREILADVVEFLKSHDWYQRIGVPFRRGYLLHGPPGNGKTSIVKAIAGELKMNIYLLMLSDPDMNDNRLHELMGLVPEKSILLLEDIDCAFTQRKR